MGHDISRCEESIAAADSMEELLAHRHGCQRYGLWMQQGSEEIEVSNGRTLDAEMKAWRMSYEASNMKAIAGLK
eukprot:g13832.t1